MLITRPLPGAAETAGRIERLGLVPVLAPMLTISRIAARLPPAHGVQAVLVTSGNAVAALPAAWHALPLLAVGDATAARAREAGFTDVRSAARDADALAALAIAVCTPQGRLLLASGSNQGRPLAATLRLAGFVVLHRAVYAARPATALPPVARSALAEGALSAALFFSPATARAFAGVITAMGGADITAIDALAISPPTASALFPLPWRRIRVASHPNQDELLALLP